MKVIKWLSKLLITIFGAWVTYVLAHLLVLFPPAFAFFYFRDGWPSSGYSIIGLVVTLVSFYLARFLSRASNGTFLHNLVTILVHKLYLTVLPITIGIAIVAIAQMVWTEYNSSWLFGQVTAFEKDVFLFRKQLEKWLDSPLFWLGLALSLLLILIKPSLNATTKYLKFKGYITLISFVLLGITSLTFFGNKMIEHRYKEMTDDYANRFLKAQLRQHQYTRSIISSELLTIKLDNTTLDEFEYIEKFLNTNIESPPVPWAAYKQLSIQISDNLSPLNLNSSSVQNAEKYTKKEAIFDNIREMEKAVDIEEKRANKLEALTQSSTEILENIIKSYFPDSPDIRVKSLTGLLISTLSSNLVKYLKPSSINDIQDVKTWIKTALTSESQNSIRQWDWSAQSIGLYDGINQEQVDTIVTNDLNRAREEASARRQAIEDSKSWHEKVIERIKKIKIRL